MREISVIMISFSAALFACGISLKMKKRVLLLEKITLFIAAVKTRIGFTAENVSDVIFSLGKSESFLSLGFPEYTFRLISQGESVQSAWKKGVEKSLSKKLKNEDISLLVSFGDGLGTTDVSGQLLNCGMYIELFSQKTQQARKNCEKYSLPVRTAGILFAAALYIIFM